MTGLDLPAALIARILAVVGVGLAFAVVVTALAAWLERREERQKKK